MAAFRHVLVADDEASIRHVLSLVLTESGYEVRAVSDGEEALKELASRSYDVVISDVRMPKVDGMALLKQALATNPELTFLVMSAYGSKDLALEAVAQGAFDFIEKPFRPEEIVFVLKKAEERARLVRENKRLKGPALPEGPLQRLLGQSEPMAALKKQIAKLAPVSTTILVTGESGTGKELVARALHERSLRKDKPFVKVNCAALPAELLESELFGFEKGAFTGAIQHKPGKFEFANRGTMFLDEIGEMSFPLQAKLLQVLQDGEFSRLGGKADVQVDVRVLAATNRNLE
ncbi:MAG TPA: sigma-54 dependent transcriptional regulator, partial [Archangium sp.]